MPSIDGRYEYSALKEANAEPTLMLGESVPGERRPCLGCGALVTTEKCSECASAAVRDWLMEGTQRQREIALTHYARVGERAVA